MIVQNDVKGESANLQLNETIQYGDLVWKRAFIKSNWRKSLINSSADLYGVGN